jgi:hypothetical protein
MLEIIIAVAGGFVGGMLFYRTRRAWRRWRGHRSLDGLLDEVIEKRKELEKQEVLGI